MEPDPIPFMQFLKGYLAKRRPWEEQPSQPDATAVNEYYYGPKDRDFTSGPMPSVEWQSAQEGMIEGTPLARSTADDVEVYWKTNPGEHYRYQSGHGADPVVPFQERDFGSVEDRQRDWKDYYVDRIESGDGRAGEGLPLRKVDGKYLWGGYGQESEVSRDRAYEILDHYALSDAKYYHGRNYMGQYHTWREERDTEKRRIDSLSRAMEKQYSPVNQYYPDSPAGVYVRSMTDTDSPREHTGPQLIPEEAPRETGVSSLPRRVVRHALGGFAEKMYQRAFGDRNENFNLPDRFVVQGPSVPPVEDHERLNHPNSLNRKGPPRFRYGNW